MNLGSIPGMYWDEEKKKYFAIQKNHKAASKNAKYTQESVARLKQEEKDHERAQKRQRTEKTQLIQRNNLLRSNLRYRSQLGREVGRASSSTANVWPNGFVSGLEARQICHVEKDIPMFIYDTSINGLLYTLNCYSDVAPHSASGVYMKLSLPPPGTLRQTRQQYHAAELRRRSFRPGRSDDAVIWDAMPGLTGLDWSPRIGDRQGWLFGITNHFQEATMFDLESKTRWCPDRGEMIDEIDVAQTIKLGSDDDELIALRSNNFCTGSEYLLAVSTREELHIVKADQYCGWMRAMKIGYPLNSRSGNSLDWLSRDIVMAGHTAGFISLNDIRTPTTRYHIKHNTKVAKVIRGMSEFEVVVCGWATASSRGSRTFDRSTMCSYDTRMIRQIIGVDKTPHARPQFVYQHYEAPQSSRFGMDALREVGIIAVSSGAALRMHSMRDGTFLREVRIDSDIKLPAENHGNITCVQAVTEQSGHMSFLASCRRNIYQFTW